MGYKTAEEEGISVREEGIYEVKKNPLR